MSIRALLAVVWILLPAAAAAQPVLAGRVLHADLPVPGATVTAARDGRSIATTTDEHGAFEFPALEPGPWTLTIEMRGFTRVTRDVTIPFADGALAIALTMRPYEEIVTRGATASSWPSPEKTAAAPAQTAIDTAQILTGSLVNGAATAFAQPRAIGNNRPRPNPLYAGNVTVALGNSAWNARPFSFGGSAPIPDYANAQIGAGFSGPLRIPFLLRDGPLTQLSFQHGVQHTATTQSGLMPSRAERDGDLSTRAAATIRDPLTGLPFPGNVIPAERIVPQAAALLGLYPLPTGTTAGGANFLRPIVNGSTTDVLQLSMNKPLSPRTTVGGSLSYQRAQMETVNLFGFTDTSENTSVTTGLTWTRRFSTRLNMRASYQFTSTGSTTTPFFANRINVSGEAGIAGNDQDPRNWGPPTIAFPDVSDLRDGVYQDSRRVSHVISGQAQYRRGRHNLTFGADARLHRIDLLTQTDPRGTLSFTGAATGDALADFLLGIPATSTIGYGNASARIAGGVYDAYVSDDFRFGAGVTFELGLRWEYESPYTERDGRLATLDVVPDFSSVAVVTGAAPEGPLTGTHYPASLVSRDRFGFQPRVGVSWRPDLASSLVIRGGYGIYRNLGVYQSIGTLLAQQPPFATTFNVPNSAETQLTLANPFPTSLPSRTTFAVDPEYRTALLHSWQVSMQGDLPASLTVLAMYSGERGLRLTQAFLPNTYPIGALDPCAACPAGFTYVTSGGTSIRHSLQLMVRRRLYAGFTTTLTYTLAKSTDNAATFSNTSIAPGSLAVAQDWLDLGAERGPSAFDQRHVVSVDAQYTTGVGIMGGTLLDGFWGRLYKDWTITGVVNAGSGLPATPVSFAVVPGTGTVGVRPSLTGQPTAPLEPGSYANAAAFVAPEPGTWGDAGRNSIRGPATFGFDLTVARVFRLKGRRTLEARVAATNVLNRVTFTAIDRIITSPQFGRPTSANQMRRVQLLFRFGF